MESEKTPNSKNNLEKEEWSQRCHHLSLDFYPVPLIHISVFVPVPCCFDACSFAV